VKKLLALLPLCIILYACPFESNVPMETRPVEPIDSSLLGYWYGIVKDGSDYFGVEALDIKKESDSSYSIIRYGKAVKGDIILPDTSYFSAYTSYLDGQRFMNIESSVVSVITRGKKAPIVTTSKVYYLANFETSHDTLIVKTISENFSVKKVFKSPAELKQAVMDLQHQHKEVFDELYSLSYKKIKKPEPLKAF
jgi:hypothetical protein